MRPHARSSAGSRAPCSLPARTASRPDSRPRPAGCWQASPGRRRPSALRNTPQRSSRPVMQDFRDGETRTRPGTPRFSGDGRRVRTRANQLENASDRVVGVWGRSAAPAAPRDSGRLASFLADAGRWSGRDRDRGHLIAHAAGGGLDLNLLPQASALNHAPVDDQPVLQPDWLPTRPVVYRAYEQRRARVARRMSLHAAPPSPRGRPGCGSSASPTRSGPAA